MKDKIKETENEKETEYTINQGWDKQKMQERRNKIKQIYIDAKSPCAKDEKTLNYEVAGISYSPLTIKQIEEIILKPETPIPNQIEETKDKVKERIEAVQALFTDVHYKDDKNDKHRDYIINSFVESDLELRSD